jgi:hypothetical protein
VLETSGSASSMTACQEIFNKISSQEISYTLQEIFAILLTLLECQIILHKKSTYTGICFWIPGREICFLGLVWTPFWSVKP